MSNIKALRQKKADISKKMRAIADRVSAEGRELNDGERGEYEKFKADYNGNEELLVIEEEQLERERNIAGVPDENDLAARRGGLTGQRDIQQYASTGDRTPKKHAALFSALFGGTTSNDNWKSSGEFLRAVFQNAHHPNLRPAFSASTANEGVPSQGGFAVATQFEIDALSAILEKSLIFSRCQISAMTSDSKQVTGFDDTDHTSGNLFGGFTAKWLAEATAGSEQIPKLRAITLNARKLALFASISNELLGDANGFDNLLTGAMADSGAWWIDDVLINGDGSGKPLGILNSPSLIVQTKESGQAASTLLYENVVNMFSRMHPACIPNSLWLANPTVIPALLKMQLVVKNVAGSENVGGSATGVVNQNGEQMTLLTRPIYFSEKMDALSSQGDILLCDPTQYVCGLRQGITIERSQHVGFMSDTAYFRMVVRLDGQSKWSKALTPKNGSSLGWAVTLQAR